MLRALILFTAMVVGAIANLASTANAAEGCGPGWWRGPGGWCHPMAVARACPVGWHLGPEDNAAGRTKDLSARALRDSISGRNVSAAGQTSRYVVRNTRSLESRDRCP